ncbi:conserved protein of unknown function [Rhodovastum atsumiense]|uniref:Magnesium transporter MgtE intracellular domain-containing protein n=2 Tax=Rhodovastum atsumiense TaxID=504468 RepID=A0A5M6IUN1_9PROT|nr:hypothetical protein [Rhodovastum atsumiense]KAA5611125.1 hypothetical protein F1189_16150 [Rhodovastum atsumiense]CAH2599190.1 conserved protein of unknown function [Rhodovastum atsumiense]
MRAVLAPPRLLPATIATMAALLTVKSVVLVGHVLPPETAHAATVPTPLMPPSPATGGGPAPVSSTGRTRPAPEVTRPEATRPEPATASEAARDQPARPAEAPAPPQALPQVPPVSDSERALLLDLRARRTEIEAQASTLGAREAALQAAEKRLAARLDELSALQTRLEALEATRRERGEANWRGLVKLYETMKPRDAATIFNDLDLPVLLAVLDRMKESKAAPVLGFMQPERARLVTAELAQLRLRANVPATPPATTSARILRPEEKQ